MRSPASFNAHCSIAQATFPKLSLAQQDLLSCYFYGNLHGSLCSQKRPKDECQKKHPSIQKKKAKDIRVEILMLEQGSNRCPNRQQAPSEKRNQESGFLLETTL